MIAPWYVIPANNKKYARIKAMCEIIKDAFSKDLDLNPQHLDQAHAGRGMREALDVEQSH